MKDLILHGTDPHAVCVESEDAKVTVLRFGEKMVPNNMSKDVKKELMSLLMERGEILKD
jgi:hypothetical protein